MSRSNGRIQTELQERSVVSRGEHRFQALVTRQELTGAIAC